MNVFRKKKSFEVSEIDLGHFQPFQSQPTAPTKARLLCLFVLGLLAADCSEHEARVMLVVGECKFPSFLSPYQLGF